MMQFKRYKKLLLACRSLLGCSCLFLDANCFFERLCSAECNLLGSRDADFFAGLRIAAFACCALLNLNDADFVQTDLGLVAYELGFDLSKKLDDEFFGDLLRELVVFACDGRNELTGRYGGCLLHAYFSFLRKPVTTLQRKFETDKKQATEKLKKSRAMKFSDSQLPLA